MQCVSVSKWSFPFIFPKQKIELTFFPWSEFLCSFLLSLSLLLSSFDFFVTQTQITKHGHIRTKKHTKHTLGIVPLKKQRCWLLKKKLGGRRGENWIRLFLSSSFFCYLFVCSSYFPYSWRGLYYIDLLGSKEKPRRVWLAIIIISLSIKPDTTIITPFFILFLFPFSIYNTQCFFFRLAHLIRIYT